MKKTFSERVENSAIQIIKQKCGYFKPSQIRALLRDKKYEITARGAVKEIEGGDIQYDAGQLGLFSEKI